MTPLKNYFILSAHLEILFLPVQAQYSTDTHQKWMWIVEGIFGCQRKRISNISGDCNTETIDLLFERVKNTLANLENALKAVRFECKNPPPHVDRAYSTLRNGSSSVLAASYFCDTGYTYGGGTPAVMCDGDSGEWGQTTFKCIECSTNTSRYQGMTNSTQGGLQCQRWDSQSPHKHNTSSWDFPENNVTLAENYCREINRSEPWCYTTDPIMEWDYCGIPKCNRQHENECGVPTSPTNTKTNYKFTSNGARVSYVCQSLSGSKLDSYCPVRKCDKYGWSAASISCGENDCFRKSSEYTGKRMCTVSGITCQMWDSLHPHNHTYTSFKFPDGPAANASNYCRDPDGRGTPWCYTTDPNVPYEYCDVPYCDKFQ